MRKLLVVVAVLTAAAAIFLGDLPTTRSAGEAPEYELIQLPGQPQAIEILRGRRARDWMGDIQRHPGRGKNLAAAMRGLRERGYRPTAQMSVTRTVNVVGGSAVRVAQEDGNVSNNDGEVFLWTWDDGDPTTWEGVIYVEAYVDGASTTWETQFDVYYPDLEVVWGESAGSDPGEGGGPEEVRFAVPRTDDNFGRANIVKVAGVTPAGGLQFVGPLVHGVISALSNEQVREHLADFAWCSGYSVGGAAAGCAVGNWWNAEIVWAPCFVGAASVMVITCGISELVDVFRDQ